MTGKVKLQRVDYSSLQGMMATRELSIKFDRLYLDVSEVEPLVDSIRLNHLDIKSKTNINIFPAYLYGKDRNC